MPVSFPQNQGAIPQDPLCLGLTSGSAVSPRPRDMLAFWGKAQPTKLGGVAWHPVAYHSLDVAATTWAYLNANPLVAKQLAVLWRLPPSRSNALACFFAAAHDVGKFALPFQAKAPEVFGTLFPLEKPRLELHNHSAVGLTTFLSWMASQWAPPEFARTAETLLEPVANAACGHHGVPESLQSRPLSSISGVAALEYLTQVDALFGATAIVAEFWPSLRAGEVDASLAAAFREASWLLAGLITLCDWVGSSQQFFPYVEAGDSVPVYWEKTRARAHHAIAACSLGEKTRAVNAGFSWLYGAAHFNRLTPSEQATAGAPYVATPLQHYADSVALPPGDTPALFVLEDETGSGKTEAALTLASRLIHAGKARGVFFCLPTQTTANTLFEQRIAPSARYFFADADTLAPSIALAHGNASYALHRMRSQPGSVLAPGTIAADLDAWARDSAKTVLLCDFGVGTVDQVALAGLPVRHVVLRHLGLARKVLIIDEAHACEPYLLAILQNTLTLHACLGGSAIILSATLPASARRKLVEAFLEGLGTRSGAAAAGTGRLDPYPLATSAWTNAAGAPQIEETAIAARSQPRPLSFIPLRQEDEAARVDQWMQDSRCVCLLRNTVRRAQQAYAAYNKRYPGKVLLVHARFALAHRAANDEALLSSFGKHSGSATRSGRIVIATQVVEQSLDIDFDEMVSDDAPIDALLQRSGRWHRHIRSVDGTPNATEGRTPSGIHVICPQVGQASFMHDLPEGTRFVYPMAGVLYRTTQLVRGCGPLSGHALEIPTQVRQAVEFAYDDEADVPEFLQEFDDAAKGTEMGARGTARVKRLQLSPGYSTHSNITRTENSVTRLGEPSVRLVLCGMNRQPLFTDDIQSQVSVRLSAIKGIEPDEDGKIRLKFSVDGALRWKCDVADAKGKVRQITYDRTLGLQI